MFQRHVPAGWILKGERKKYSILEGIFPKENIVGLTRKDLCLKKEKCRKQLSLIG